MRRAQGDAVDRRQVGGDEVRRVAVDHRLGAEALGLGLVVGGERGAARVADEDDALAAELVTHELHAGAEVLQDALHQQHRVVADVARVEAEAGDAAIGERPDQVVAHEVAGRVHDDRADASASAARRVRRDLVGAVDARPQHLQAGLALHRRARLDVDDGEMALAPLRHPSRPSRRLRRRRNGGSRNLHRSHRRPARRRPSEPVPPPRRASFSRVHDSTAACASRAWRAVVSALAVGTVSSRRMPFGSKK